MFFGAWCLVLGAFPALAAADSGDSVVVIYNSLVPESKSVADHYAARRQVPAGQILGLNLPTTETMTRVEFRDQLQHPLLHWLEEKKYFVFKAGNNSATPRTLQETKIRYAVLCYGVPLRILHDATLQETNAEKNLPELRRNGAAVESELACLPASEQKLPITGVLMNPFFGITNAAFMQPANNILLVARLDGPNAAIANALVDKALEAETNGLWGRAYFDLRGLTNGDFKAGDDWIRAAAEATRQFGFETVVDEKPETFSAAFPMSQIALYAGWYDVDVSGPFAQAKVEFMPGAFAYHLHSFSAATLRDAKRNWCGPLLAAGATATMGCVDEPQLGGTPDIGIFFNRFLAGFSFGEAAYASQNSLSWQTTVVGDPLYRPFGKNPRTQHEVLEKTKNKLLEWSHLRVVDLNLVKGYPVADTVNYLEAAGTNSAVLTEKLAELYQAQGKPESSMRTIRKALKLDPTPQQKIRLTLTLAEKLETAKKNSEAMEVYKEFLAQRPDYPDKTFLQKKIEQLSLQK